MKALTWQGKRDVAIREVPDPLIQLPTDVLVKVTSTAICGSDLHLYEVMGPFLDAGDVLGHEAMGVVTEIGSAIDNLTVGDRVVIPFNISCGHCFMCTRNLQSQCETTQVREQAKGAALFGYTKLYGSVPGGQAEYLRVPQGQYGPIKVSADGPDERYLFLSDILPTAWQGVQYAGLGEGGTLAVMGLGPVGQLAARIGVHLGHRVLAMDPVPERRAMAQRHGVVTVDPDSLDEPADWIREQTDGRGADAVLDAVGMEAHGSPESTISRLAQTAAGMLPDSLAQKVFTHAGVDRLTALYRAIQAVRRGGTVSISGVYGGAVDPLPMMDLFDKQITVKMGQCNVKAWIGDLLPLVDDPADPLGLLDLTTHTAPLEQAPELYRTFQEKADGCIKVVLKP